MHTLHRAIRQASIASIFATIALASTTAQSASYEWLTSPSLVGLNTGGDSFLGNGNDQFLNGTNTIGAASQVLDSNGSFGFFQGSFTLQGNTIFGPQEQVVFGSNTFTYFNSTCSWGPNMVLPWRVNEP